MPQAINRDQKYLEKFKSRVTIEKLKKVVRSISVHNKKTYLTSYRDFLLYFQRLKKISKHDVVIGIHFVYGWMPTVFHFRSNNLSDVVKILNSAKDGEIPNVSDLCLLRDCFNGSLVGTSKLLHFINPSKFAIWDSRVYLYLVGKKPYNNQLKNPEIYLDYLDFCNHITTQQDFQNIHKALEMKVGYKMTKLRAVELIMFLA